MRLCLEYQKINSGTMMVGSWGRGRGDGVHDRSYWLSHYIGFIFSHTFLLIKMKFDVVMKQSNLNISRLLLGNCCFTDCVKKINVVMLGMFMNQVDSNVV